MPMTVVTLSRCPASLRGDLTKWMQEVATGVYVGNFNSRVREQLWERITQSAGSGAVTMSFAAQNEIGYDFKLKNAQREVIYESGIPLVYIPSPVVCVSKDDAGDSGVGSVGDGGVAGDGAGAVCYGFSKAARFRKARQYSSKRPAKLNAKAKHELIQTDEVTKYTCGCSLRDVLSATLTNECVFVDIETDGLCAGQNRILELGAVKWCSGEVHEYHCLVAGSNDYVVPTDATTLTGITTQMLYEQGISEGEALGALRTFIGDLPIVGYNIAFDMNFLTAAYRGAHKDALTNKTIDLLRFVKQEKLFLKSYKLENVLGEYGIIEKLPHRALEDARLTALLATKVNKFVHFLK